MSTKKKPKATKSDQLSPKRERFCQEFVVDCNKTKAAERAEYSKQSAASQGARLYRNAKVKARIKELQALQQERVGITQDKWIREYEKVAFLKTTDVFHFGEETVNIDGVDITVARVRLKKKSELSDAVLSSISSIKETQQGISIKFYDKLKSLDSIGKHYGWLNDKLEHSGPNGQPIETVFNINFIDQPKGE